MASGYRKDKTTSANAAVMSAAGIVSREDTGDQAGSDVGQRVVDIAKTIFEGFLSAVVDGDNATFAEAETSAPASKAKGATPTGDPGDVQFTGGKFKGCTIREVYEMDESTAKETYGHQFGDGSSYIKNYVATPKNSIQATRTAAEAFLAGLGG